ncbi:MAG: hypothetical protein A2096_10000 [Spirochaetes bacterium GWF1_41_5]|nr:MAG: hypothetical protein A2096_10000 [Spirochaetes bacterium GWF1_41_5]HBE01309.1 hypothetical protein [Spirochaetia bacterium]
MVNFKNESITSECLVLSGNPVGMALSPTLSLAFIKGYIKSPEQVFYIVHGKNEDNFLDFISQMGLNKDNGNKEYPASLGFIYKIRKKLFDETKNSSPVLDISPGVFKSISGEIIWSFTDKNKTLLTINTPKYQFAAGRLDTVKAQLSNISVSFDQHGAMTAIALDDILLFIQKVF